MHQGSATMLLTGLTALVLLLVSYADDQTRECEWENVTPTMRVEVCHCYQINRGTFGNVRVEVDCPQGSKSVAPKPN
jgi:hypothetical protein